MPSTQQSGDDKAPSLADMVFETVNRHMNMYKGPDDGISVARSVLLLLLLVAAILFSLVIWIRGGKAKGQGRESDTEDVGVSTTKRNQKWNAPPAIPETIPFISNAIAYITRPKAFLERAAKTLSRTNLATFHLGPIPVTLVTGSAQVQSLFRSQDVSAERFLLLILENLRGMSKSDVAGFKADRTGRRRIPRTDDDDNSKRLWYRQAEIHEFIARPEVTATLARTFTRFFSAAIEETQPLGGDWVEDVRIFAFLKHEMGTAAVASLSGTEVLRRVPNYVKRFWEFDSVGLRLVWGLPRFLDPEPVRVRNAFHDDVADFLDEAFKQWDAKKKEREGRNEKEEDPDWEPIFGNRFTRLAQTFVRDIGVSRRGQAGTLNTHVLGINSNTIPLTAWALFELVKRPDLFAAVREEANTALIHDHGEEGMGEEGPQPRGGGGRGNHSRPSRRQFDLKKLVSLPLLQAVYTEVLRLHVAIYVTRQALRPTTIAGYSVAAGTLLQTPTSLAGRDDAVWARKPNYPPASEFWPGRHLREARSPTSSSPRLEFVPSARSADFFPFGGGPSICPGRHFAKQEIMLAVAMLVSRFDMEFVDWVYHDDHNGHARTSDREAKEDDRFFGAASVPPDRDMRVRWRRIW
ncbi:cytochrome P450 [Sodiomyces alkalinus F11]|uniref:Cytochrome P450 n=1 Tax=Sodiomyces alkalinus (strain CBS 110278 / VKM F-3762 / F11) TaxID=1314773 RepID=A0A3N2PML3_SODAK|nr:cytochrome P450 [Sodiomyces alkalinus F11]ROT35576.1 cytochrome P450 [Sodiomyces alkalinus F11]